MSFFGEEATLFAREYAIVEALRTAWASDLQRFFEALHPAVDERLHEKGLDAKLSTKHSKEYRYWWIPSEVPKVGNATLWYAKEYPELIRDGQVHWSAYLDIMGARADEALQKAWVQLAMPELQKLEGVSLMLGSAATFRPLRLVFRWREDPISESAPLIADSLNILHRAILKLGKPG
jgi:hypothetical protein